MVFEFDGTKYERLRDMRAARRAKPPDPVRGGMDFTRAAHAVGVSKRTGKAWRNGRTRSTGRNGRPLVDRCRGGMDERIAIADMRRAGSGVRSIARTPGRAPSTNENTNGLPRQYPPKGTDPSGYTEKHPDAAAMEPDDRPRKTPDHTKPNEKTLELTDDTATPTETITPTVNKDVATTIRIRHSLFHAPPLLPFLFSPLASHHTPQYQPTSLSSPDLAIHLNVTQNNTLTNTTQQHSHSPHTTHQPINKHNISQPNNQSAKHNNQPHQHNSQTNNKPKTSPNNQGAGNRQRPEIREMHPTSQP